MLRPVRTLAAAFALPAALSLSSPFLAGCTSGETTGEPETAEHVGEDGHADGHTHAGHDHPDHGPHGGDLVELGGEEYHAEVVHEAGKVTVYVLDGAAKTAVPVDATEVTINVTHDGKPEQFKLPAAPQESDGQGKSSRFTSDDADLAARLDGEGQARLLLTIDGKSYNGAVEHHHDHEGHDHAH